jgi:hypothetical protein
MCGGGGSPSTTGGGGTPGSTTECDRIRLVQVVEAVPLPDGSYDHQAPPSRVQYINMDWAPDHLDFGRRVRLRARVAWASGSTRSLSGQTVYWYFVPGGSNRAGLPAGLRASFDSEGGGLLRTTSTADASGWTEAVDFYLSQYGGDSFQVYATDNSSYSGGMLAGNFVVWRRIFWELDCMQRPGGAGSYSDRADTARMDQQFRRLFVHLVRTGTDAGPAHRRMIKENDADAWATGVRDGTGAPRYFHLCLIDTICWDPAPTVLILNVTAERYVRRLPGGRYLLEAGHWFRRATYTAADGATGALTAANFSLREAGDPSNGDDRFILTVNLPDSLARPVRVRLVFTNWEEGSGLQAGRSTLVGLRWRERRWHTSPSDINDSTLHTMVHEPGHAFGLAAQTLPTGANNPNYYVSTGGPHCNALANDCIMFEANSPSLTLCDNCTDSVKGRNLAALPIAATAGY